MVGTFTTVEITRFEASANQLELQFVPCGFANLACTLIHDVLDIPEVAVEIPGTVVRDTLQCLNHSDEFGVNVGTRHDRAFLLAMNPLAFAVVFDNDVGIAGMRMAGDKGRIAVAAEDDGQLPLFVSGATI